MSSTLTIRNLDESVKQKLRVQAALHGHSMEAEAREILTRDVMRVSHGPGVSPAAGKFDNFVGIWKNRMTTEDVMKITREE